MRAKYFSFLIYVTIAFLCIISSQAVFPGGSRAESEAETRAREKRLLKNMRSDNPDRILKAVYYFSARRKAKFVRPLGRQLNKHLDISSNHLKTAVNDPYIKSQMAVALGRIARVESLPYLFNALAKTSDIIETGLKINVMLREKERKFAASFERKRGGSGKGSAEYRSINEKPIPRLIIDRDRPGPALLRKGSGIPFSPDVHWSIADDFKGIISPDNNNELHRMRMIGYNYVNLMIDILDAIGEIYYRADLTDRLEFSVRDTDAVKNYLNHKFPDVRRIAARTMGKIAYGLDNRSILGLLDNQLKKENDPRVKVCLCHAILMNERGRMDCWKTIIKLLKHDDNNVRYDVAITLSDLKFGEVIIPLRKAILLEENSLIKTLLKKALYYSTVESLTPAPYDG